MRHGGTQSRDRLISHESNPRVIRFLSIGKALKRLRLTNWTVANACFRLLNNDSYFSILDRLVMKFIRIWLKSRFVLAST
jgi:hypothetical protein